MPDERTNFDVVLRAVMAQRQNDSHGGGLIGIAGAVVEALGLDPDGPFLPAPAARGPES